MTVKNLTKKITKDEYLNYTQVDCLEFIELSITSKRNSYWIFEQYIPVDKKETMVIRCAFTNNNGEKPTKRQLEICKSQFSTEPQRENAHYIYADGTDVERSFMYCSTEDAVRHINYLIEKLNRGWTEGLVKGVTTAFYMPKNMRAHSHKAPAKKPAKKFPKLNVEVMF